MLSLFKKTKNSKILDTSILVDGRILKLMQTGFLEGNIVIPQCVIFELQNLADCSDANKRKRGRRGLDVLKELTDKYAISILEKETDEIKQIKEVDAKLVLICRNLESKLITLDYNLNKVAKAYSVPVLNINDLFNAIKPTVMSGDKIQIKIVRQGEQENQGIGSLEDGTMVVVDEGSDFIGKKVQIEVRQVLQSSSGRIVFASVLRRRNG